MTIEFNWYDNVQNIVNEACKSGVKLSAEYLLTEAIKTTPKDDGILRQSGNASHDENNLESCISFNTPYAVRLHEHPEYNFQGSGRGKWLELTLKEEQKEIEKLIADTIKTSLNQGGGA